MGRHYFSSLSAIEGEVLGNNHKMLKLMARLGFTVTASDEASGIVKASKTL